MDWEKAMLTDEQANEIDAEYADLPGTKPDGYSWANISDLESCTAWYREKRSEWKEMQWARITIREEDDTVWLEVWKERPQKEAPFDPPYQLQSTGDT